MWICSFNISIQLTFEIFTCLRMSIRCEHTLIRTTLNLNAATCFVTLKLVETLLSLDGIQHYIVRNVCDTYEIIIIPQYLPKFETRNLCRVYANQKSVELKGLLLYRDLTNEAQMWVDTGVERVIVWRASWQMSSVPILVALRELKRSFLIQQILVRQCLYAINERSITNINSKTTILITWHNNRSLAIMYLLWLYDDGPYLEFKLQYFLYIRL